MPEKPIYCVICDKQMGNEDPKGYQPSGGTVFTSLGHYGSTIFDPMDGSALHVAFCDSCIVERAQHFRVTPPETSENYSYSIFTPTDSERKWVREQARYYVLYEDYPMELPSKEKLTYLAPTDKGVLVDYLGDALLLTSEQEVAFGKDRFTVSWAATEEVGMRSNHRVILELLPE